MHTIAHLFLLSTNCSKFTKNSSDAQLLSVKFDSKCNLKETFAAVSVYITVCKLKVNSNFLLPFKCQFKWNNIWFKVNKWNVNLVIHVHHVSYNLRKWYKSHSTFDVKVSNIPFKLHFR